MTFRLYHVASVILLGAILFSGMLNNGLSAICAGMAMICWIAIARLERGAIAVGFVAILGWVLIAALVSTAF